MLACLVLCFHFQERTPAQEPPKPKPEFVRNLDAKTKRTYALKVTTGPATIIHTYTMEMRCLKPKVGQEETSIEFILTNLKTEFDSQVVEKKTFGKIDAQAAKTGFFDGPSMTSDIVAFTLPLLSFWLPDDKQDIGKWIPVRTPTFSPAIFFEGDGRVIKSSEGEVDLTLDMKLKVEGESPDQSKSRRFRSASVIEPKDGSLISAEGKYSGPDGTITYSIRRT